MTKYICPKCNGTAEYTVFAYKCNGCGTIFDSLEKGIYERCAFGYHDWFREKYGMSQWNWAERQLDLTREQINQQINLSFADYEVYCREHGITPDHNYTLGKRYTMTEIPE